MAEIIGRLRGENLTPDEVCKGYDEWSKSYDIDTKDDLGYAGYENCCDVINKYFGEDKERIAIFDVGAGTGLLGETLKRNGFKIIDGIDPSRGMLDIAEKKNIYRTLYCRYFTSEPTDVLTNDMYDIVTSSGCLNPGHLPYDSVIEMVRITKPGGLVCVTGRLNSVEDSQEYANLIPLCDRLEKEKQWEKLEVWKYSGYHTKEDVTGIMFVYRVL